MLINQYQSRRQWHILPSDPKEKVVVIWWKVTQGKRPEELKYARVFIEIFIDESKYTRVEQEKNFNASLKGYGAVISRKEYTIQDLNKKI
jgi:hypothetical protein